MYGINELKYQIRLKIELETQNIKLKHKVVEHRGLHPYLSFFSILDK